MTEQEVNQIRKDFPFFDRRGIVYLDNAATMQKPQVVLDQVQKFYAKDNANPLRGLYDLSVAATTRLEVVREKVARLIGAKKPEEIVFTSGATAGLNMLASSLAVALTSDDDILIGNDAHHSNLLPWVELSGATGAGLRVVQSQGDGTLSLADLEMQLTPNTRAVAVTMMSNVTGGQSDIGAIVQVVRSRVPGAIVIVDAAQAVAHQKIDVVADGIDFLVFSGHKLGAPMGVGVMYGRWDWLEQMRPVNYGGEMVDSVTLNEEQIRVQLTTAPQRLEAGTLNMGGIVGLGAAIDYLEAHQPQKLFKHVTELTKYAEKQLKKLPEVELYWAQNGILTFEVVGVHPHDVAQILNEERVYVRAGYHCAQPFLEAAEIGPVVRASLAFYNTKAEIDKLVVALGQVKQRMGQ